MKYLIRPCEEKDLPDLVQLCADHAAYEKSEYSPEGKIEGLREAIFGTPKRLNVWIVEIDGKAEGFTSFTFDFSTWDAAPFLYWIAFISMKIAEVHRCRNHAQDP
jgi:hypothetical protein